MLSEAGGVPSGNLASYHDLVPCKVALPTREMLQLSECKELGGTERQNQQG